jgi:hypothetical protein
LPARCRHALSLVNVDDAATFIEENNKLRECVPPSFSIPRGHITHTVEGKPSGSCGLWVIAGMRLFMQPNTSCSSCVHRPLHFTTKENKPASSLVTASAQALQHP